ncbi:cold-shock protein [Amycolatopsis sp. cmx-4-61]|uniref:cold-shock protein n=1 Tax=Amycolatopsis sp. cmx-4-61 TaxID=2790937 RepID=UPI00397820D8
MDETDPEIQRLLELYARDIEALGGPPPERRSLVAGQRVEFEIVQGPPGPRAVRVVPLPEKVKDEAEQAPLDAQEADHAT